MRRPDGREILAMLWVGILSIVLAGLAGGVAYFGWALARRLLGCFA